MSCLTEIEGKNNFATREDEQLIVLLKRHRFPHTLSEAQGIFYISKGTYYPKKETVSVLGSIYLGVF